MNSFVLEHIFSSNPKVFHKVGFFGKSIRFLYNKIRKHAAKQNVKNSVVSSTQPKTTTTTEDTMTDATTTWPRPQPRRLRPDYVYQRKVLSQGTLYSCYRGSYMWTI